MGNEVTKNSNEVRTRRYVVADGTAIRKGYFLQLTAGKLAASYAVGLAQPCAGIAAMDKEANDGSTSITAWVGGDFNVYCSGSITAGHPIVKCSGSLGDDGVVNAVQANKAGADASGASILGYALESATNTQTKCMHIDL